LEDSLPFSLSLISPLPSFFPLLFFLRSSTAAEIVERKDADFVEEPLGFLYLSCYSFLLFFLSLDKKNPKAPRRNRQLSVRRFQLERVEKEAAPFFSPPPLSPFSLHPATFGYRQFSFFLIKEEEGDSSFFSLFLFPCSSPVLTEFRSSLTGKREGGREEESFPFPPPPSRANLAKGNSQKSGTASAHNRPTDR